MGNKSSKKNAGRKIGLSNNVIAALAIIFCLLSIASNVILFVRTGGLNTAGYVTAESTGMVNLSLMDFPKSKIQILTPSNCEVVKGNDVNVSAHLDMENFTFIVVNVLFTYTDDILNGNWTEIGSLTNNGSGNYTVKWDTTLLPDGSFYYITASATDAYHHNAVGTTFGPIIINNVDKEPDWTSFKFKVSTNLSVPSTWDHILNLKLGNTYGRVSYPDWRLNVDDFNLSRYIFITNRSIALDSSYLICLNYPAKLDYFNVNIMYPLMYRNNVPCSAEVCRNLSSDGRNVTVNVTGFSTYLVREAVFMSLWDITDNHIPGGEIRSKNQLVEFYVNLTSRRLPLYNNNTNCYIQFNDTEYSLMTYDPMGLYFYNRTFRHPGIYNWSAVCNSTEDLLLNLSDFDTVEITNRAPRQIAILPNITMNGDTTVLYINNLGNYFEDPEGDIITYNVSRTSNVDIKVISDSIIITPAYRWYGNRTFVVYAKDEYGLTNTSNIVYLTVLYVPEKTQPPSSGSGGGDGGSGDWEPEGSDEEFKESPDCHDEWECSIWGECEYRWAEVNLTVGKDGKPIVVIPEDINYTDGIARRSCVDIHHCYYWWKTPNETENCLYTPTCKDELKNCHIDGSCEEGVDCGGPCSPCFSCEDGILNQGETKIDCGGPCKPCPTCYDNTKNCHDGSCEEGIDCGGPCLGMCPAVEMPGVISLDWYTILIILLLIIITVFTAYIVVRPYIVSLLLWLLALFKKKEEEPEKTLLELEAEYIELLTRLERRAAKEDIPEISTELHSIFRHFIMAALKSDKEMTSEELGEALKALKMPTMLQIAISTFMKESVEMDYGHSLPNRKEFIDRIGRTKKLMDLIVTNWPKEKEGSVSGNKGGVKSKKRAAKKISNNMKSGNKKVFWLNREQQDKANRLRLYKLGIDARKLIIKKDINGAEKLKKEFESAYNHLEKKDQSQFASALSELNILIDSAKEKREK